MRKLHISYKQRDALFDEKRSVYYSLIHKCLTSLYLLQEDKTLRLLNMSKNEVATLIVDKKIVNLTVEDYSKTQLCQRFLKNMQNSISMVIIKPESHPLMTKA